ncbi:MAG: hypothetical protein AB1730_17530 [Myxococcota bacterium]|jgi:hypothetical protein
MLDVTRRFAVLSVALVALGARPAGADATWVPSAEGLDAEQMQERMTTYFAAEQRTGVFAGSLGLLSVGAGIGLWASDGKLERGVAVPLLVMGALQVALGVALSVRTPRQVKRLEAQLAEAPAEFATAERERMHRVNSRWWVYRAVEVSVAFSGILVAGAGGATGTDAAVGVGLALVGEALVMLLIDHFAEARAGVYESALLGFRF